ncbi:hypothetical protein NAI30_10820, partial [Francisella tularensis subsp. holarctica]|nr:hypothetical protein [Francisella tularensis subsp. holarctica]
NDPTAPVRNNNPTTSELFEEENIFNYNNNIQNSQNAGGTPTLELQIILATIKQRNLFNIIGLLLSQKIIKLLRCCIKIIKF